MLIRVLVVAFLFVSGGAAQSVAPFDAHRDLDYRPLVEVGDKKDRLDVFMPPGADGVAVLVHFHGGALMAGDKATPQRPDFFPARFVSEGIGVVMANYRLSPAVRYPVHLEDAAAAVAWVFDNIAGYGGNPEQIYISGHSAGGYLAAMLALDGRYLGHHGIRPSSVRGTIPISPFLDVEEVAPERDKSVWGNDAAAWREASPMTYLAKAQPMLLIVADRDADWRKAQNARVHEALSALGSDIELIEAPNRTHLSLISRVDAGDDVVATAIIDFVRRHAGLSSGHRR